LISLAEVETADIVNRRDWGAVLLLVGGEDSGGLERVTSDPP
jgi:hypothetical protein